MKLQLNKKKLKNLSKDAQILPGDMTPQIGGGITAAATCPPTTTQDETVITCDSDCVECDPIGPGGGGGISNDLQCVNTDNTASFAC